VRRVVFLLAILMLVIFVLAGCSSQSQATPSQPAASKPITTAPAQTTTAPAATTAATIATAKTPVYGGTFRYLCATGPGGPFGVPWNAMGGNTFPMQFGLQTLVREMLDTSMQLGLAESYSTDTSADNPSIMFKLRKGIKFQDGTDFNAQAVKWCLDNDAKTGSSQIGQTTNWKSVEVVDDYTIRINLKTWQNTALRPFASASGYIISPAAYQKNGVDWANYNMVGTGAFNQTDFQRDVSLTCIKNPNYWEPGKPYLDKLQYMFISDALTAEAAFKTGAAEVIQCHTDQMADNLKKAGYKVISYPGFTFTMYPDSKDADSPWSNLKFRQAAEYAINKEAIANAMGYGTWATSYQYCSPSSPAFDPNLTPRKYDAAKARQLLSEAGFPNGVKTTIYSAPAGMSKDIPLAFQADWKAVGIDATIENPQADAFSVMQRGTWKNGVIIGPGAISANPIAGFNNYTSSGTMFLSIKRPDGFDALYKAALSSPKLDPALAQKCEDAMYAESTIIPLFITPTTWGVTNNVQDSGLGTGGIFSQFNCQNLWLSK
jgi:peptide/nickel transport system substrate-binding protein